MVWLEDVNSSIYLSVKLYANIVNARLVTFTEKHFYRSPAQAAFRPKFSTLHCLFVMQHVIEISQKRGERLFCCFLDLNSAYDCVHRPLLWNVLSRLGVHGRMLGAIKSLYENASYAMKINGRVGDPQPSLTGSRQGCPLSPTLFGLFLDGPSHHLQSQCLKRDAFSHLASQSHTSCMQMTLLSLLRSLNIFRVSSTVQSLSANAWG